nr:hypothetical protein [Tanacetum cinerariifolium]
MLDRTDFASWQQRIRLYCRGKKNGVNILKSIDEGPFQMGTFRETLSEGTEGAAGYGGARNRVGYANPGQARQIKCYNCNGIGHIVKNHTQPKRPQNLEYFKDKMLLMQAQENGVALDEEQLLFIAGGQDNVVDDDVDEQPIQDLALNTMFMANLSSADPVYDEVSPSYDSNILSEVHDHDHYQDGACEHHEEHEMHDDVQPTYVVDSHANYTHDSDMIPYDQYVKDNAVLVVQNDVSSVPNDVYMMILNDMHEQPNQHVSGTTQNTVVDKSLTAELAIYKEQVELKKMNEKMNDLECVKKKVKIAPRDYSKENYLATFTPQKQLAREQIFWSKDLIKMKSEALKEQTTASRPMKALTVYPPNTPATLVPKMLPTKSQVKINIFALIQLFWEFEKTCKKRITLAGFTGGERGFEQTKECYLTKVIPFFKTLKEYFEGIQKALMSRFSNMHEALNAAQQRIADLESKNSNLQKKIQNDDHDVMVNHFSKLEVEHLNLQLKYQHLKESLKNRKSMTSSDGPTFDSVFVIGKLKDQI